MAVRWINNLNVNREAGRPKHDAWQSHGFVPLEVRAGGKPKALLASGMIDGMRRDADGLIGLCIVLSEDPDISRQTDAGIDRVPP